MDITEYSVLTFELRLHLEAGNMICPSACQAVGELINSRGEFPFWQRHSSVKFTFTDPSATTILMYLPSPRPNAIIFDCQTSEQALIDHVYVKVESFQTSIYHSLVWNTRAGRFHDTWMSSILGSLSREGEEEKRFSAYDYLTARPVEGAARGTSSPKKYPVSFGL